MDNARFNTKHQSLINKANGLNVKADNSLAQYTVISTSCTQFGMQWSRLGI